MNRETYVYSVFDTLAGEYGPPFVQMNDQLAYRAFKSLLEDQPVHVRRDFQLRKIGTFDSVNGDLNAIDVYVVEGIRSDTGVLEIRELKEE